MVVVVGTTALKLLYLVVGGTDGVGDVGSGGGCDSVQVVAADGNGSCC